MRALRFVSVVTLSVWMGTLAVLGAIAAPTIFAVLEAQDPAGGRSTAGLVFGEVFQRFQYTAWGLGALLLVATAIRSKRDRGMRRPALRLFVIAGLVAMSVFTATVLAPRIDALRRDTPGPIVALPETDARRVAFGRLHGLSSGLMLVTLAGGLALLWAEGTE